MSLGVLVSWLASGSFISVESGRSSIEVGDACYVLTSYHVMLRRFPILALVESINVYMRKGEYSRPGAARPGPLLCMFFLAMEWLALPLVATNRHASCFLVALDFLSLLSCPGVAAIDRHAYILSFM